MGHEKQKFICRSVRYGFNYQRCVRSVNSTRNFILLLYFLFDNFRCTIYDSKFIFRGQTDFHFLTFQYKLLTTFANSLCYSRRFNILFFSKLSVFISLLIRILSTFHECFISVRTISRQPFVRSLTVSRKTTQNHWRKSPEYSPVTLSNFKKIPKHIPETICRCSSILTKNKGIPGEYSSSFLEYKN